ncbi:plasmid mobilization protein [Actinomadura kijaniata]|uniref:plasmid mobilization protein n=1 Tax=Actinomadura kijaniata TaxID=46161 RepID=UPI003F1AA9C2
MEHKQASATDGGGRQRARQRRHPGGRRHQALVKMSDEEYLQIAARAAVAGVSVPRLLVEAALAGDQQAASERRALVAEFLAVRRLLAAVSNNVNQLAMVANATGEVPAQLLATLHAVARVTARLEAATDELGGPVGER